MEETFSWKMRNQLEQLDLKEFPFAITADTRWFYRSQLHYTILSHLADHAEIGGGGAVVIGAMGSGKTMLAHLLEQQFALIPSLVTRYIHTVAYRTTYEAVQDISTAFGIQKRKRYIDQLREFEQYLVEVQNAGKRVVLIIDDAQLISEKALPAFQHFLNFEKGNKLFNPIFFGQPELSVLLGKLESLFDRILTWEALGALTYVEMVEMIRYRLSVAGRTDPLFSQSAYEMIYEYSMGVPRKAIVACKHVLTDLLDSDPPKSKADERDVKRALSRIPARPQGVADE